MFCHFIVLQHDRGRKISKRENNINQFITISENTWTRDQNHVCRVSLLFQ